MHYSIAILPPRFILNRVQKLKRELRREIGTYQSWNSEAHFTICTLDVHERELDLWLKKLQRVCVEAGTFKVHLDSIKTFSNNSVYLAPDEASRKNTRKFMAAIHQETKSLRAIRTYEPHMTIARNLNEIQLIKTKNHFIGELIDMSFECNQLSIRKLDLTKHQYQVEYAYSFEGRGYDSDKPQQLGFWDL